MLLQLAGMPLIRLLPKESVFEIPSLKGTAIQIVKTNITDNEGNVVKVIG
ncbi:hypothetical protein [Paenibacillus uliginis]|nr:hypothetical protein [Paenibacillus uliginis]